MPVKRQCRNLRWCFKHQEARRALELTGTVQLTVQERDPQAGEGSPRLPSASKSELRRKVAELKVSDCAWKAGVVASLESSGSLPVVG
jgi:hypothetical protein